MPDARLGKDCFPFASAALYKHRVAQALFKQQQQQEAEQGDEAEAGHYQPPTAPYMGPYMHPYMPPHHPAYPMSPYLVNPHNLGISAHPNRWRLFQHTVGSPLSEFNRGARSSPR